MEKYEYKTIIGSNNNKPLQDLLNELGEDGWEFVQYVGSTFVFKRKKVDSYSANSKKLLKD